MHSSNPPLSTFHLYTKTITIITTVLFAVIAVLLFAFQTQAQTPVNVSAQTIQDGDLIRATETQDIYIVKIINEKRFKRLIINPDIFDSYGHLEWENVQNVSQSVVDRYTTSNLVRRDQEQTIYRIYPDSDSGSKAQVDLAFEQFGEAGIDIDSIYIINENEFNLYRTLDPITTPEEYRTTTVPTEEAEETSTPPAESTPPPADGSIEQPQTIQDGDLIRATGTDDVYIVKIINNKQFKRLIINPDIFESYGHLEWENVKDVPQSVVDSYATSNLVRKDRSQTIYRIYPSGDGGTKAQVDLTLDQLSQSGIDTDSIYIINTNEFNLYRTLAPITTPEDYTPEEEQSATTPTDEETVTIPEEPPAPEESDVSSTPPPIIISVITDNKVRPPKKPKNNRTNTNDSHNTMEQSVKRRPRIRNTMVRRILRPKHRMDKQTKHTRQKHNNAHHRKP